MSVDLLQFHVLIWNYSFKFFSECLRCTTDSSYIANSFSLRFVMHSVERCMDVNAVLGEAYLFDPGPEEFTLELQQFGRKTKIRHKEQSIVLQIKNAAVELFQTSKREFQACQTLKDSARTHKNAIEVLEKFD